MPNTHLCDDTAALGGQTATGPGRTLISDSWRRSLAAGVDPDLRIAPLVFDSDMVADVRASTPLHGHLPMLRETLRHMADATAHLMVITDGSGHVLWSEGPPGVLRRAHGIGLVEGFRWSEDAVGTNGIGTALGARSAAYVRGAEHLVRALHSWSCAAAPVTDPDTGQVIGCVNISATVNSLHPAVIALVEAAARLTEARLAHEMHRHDELLRARYQRHLRGGTRALVTATGRVLAAESEGWRGRRLPAPEAGRRIVLPDGAISIAEPLGQAFLLRTADPHGEHPVSRAPGERPYLTLRLLGGGRPHAVIDGRRVALSLRHAELLALLALHPAGLTCEQSSLHLYGDEGNPVTLRAEIHRLRAQLGDVVRAKPYRLGCDVDADFLIVRRLLAAGDVAGAVRSYPGPLLPRSEAPAIRWERDELAAQLRRQLLARGDAEALWVYAQTGDDDPEILRRLATRLPAGDPRRVSAQRRENRVLADD